MHAHQPLGFHAKGMPDVPMSTIVHNIRTYMYTVASRRGGIY